MNLLKKVSNCFLGVFIFYNVILFITALQIMLEPSEMVIGIVSVGLFIPSVVLLGVYLSIQIYMSLIVMNEKLIRFINWVVLGVALVYTGVLMFFLIPLMFLGNGNFIMNENILMSMVPMFALFTVVITLGILLKLRIKDI
ncbi:hypothetical protein BN85413900 [Alteracholeplasma palmae J233]|uniref:Uncharacterized protein n=1 Tax=Alteracholeplasma palmae (strain ATCC 49389 / J233) TaxID=1318466 RepID=U4KLX6_ALTPJ|nr:hypothetical protein [Alteracholeplasma palmae]CCV64967.1 hypothetical protein BN85413900 [Alteracholeplasma palmae J233]